jgi:hypothetical protein
MGINSAMHPVALQLKLGVEWFFLSTFPSILDYEIVFLTASLMSAPPCRDVVIEIEDTKPLLASKVGFRTDHFIFQASKHLMNQSISHLMLLK